ncbi:MAG TPA: hypothetical protein VF950_23115 [Planctomycetota bacterium]
MEIVLEIARGWPPPFDDPKPEPKLTALLSGDDERPALVGSRNSSIGFFHIRADGGAGSDQLLLDHSSGP